MSYSYQDYVQYYCKEETTDRYNWRYRESLRESDRRLVEILSEKSNGAAHVSLLDLGCGNGNLLYHVRNRFPGWTLSGRDLAGPMVTQCRQDEALAGIDFDNKDLTEPPSDDERALRDFVVINAVLQVLPPALFARALENARQYLKPGGWLINFDGYHPYVEQEIVKIEIQASAACPDLPIMEYTYPSRAVARDWCARAGFARVEFEEFYVPLDLARPEGSSSATHTARLEDGRRLSMLGVVAQPWTFLMAQS